MNTMVKLRGGSKRLRLGSWDVLVSRFLGPGKHSQGVSRSFTSTPAAKELASAAAVSNGTPTDDVKSSTSVMVDLAATITRETQKLNKYMKDNNLPPISFDVSSPLNFPKLSDEAKRSRDIVMQATNDLCDLVTGPRESIRWMSWAHNKSLSLHAIYHYRMAEAVPVHGTATFKEISEKTGLDETNVKRFLRHAMTSRIFKEVEPGVVAHTPKSRVLAEDKAMDDWVGFCTEDMWPVSLMFSLVLVTILHHYTIPQSKSGLEYQLGSCRARWVSEDRSYVNYHQCYILVS
jgi:hypothetical protein